MIYFSEFGTPGFARKDAYSSDSPTSEVDVLGLSANSIQADASIVQTSETKPSQSSGLAQHEHPMQISYCMDDF